MIKTAMLAGAAHGNVSSGIQNVEHLAHWVFALQTWKFRWDLHGGPSLCNGVRVLDPKISRVRIYMYYTPKLFRQEESGAMHVHLTPHFYVLFFFIIWWLFFSFWLWASPLGNDIGLYAILGSSICTRQFHFIGSRLYLETTRIIKWTRTRKPSTTSPY